MDIIRVLLVDDKQENIETFKALFQAPRFIEEFKGVCSGFEITSTRSAAEAFRLIETESFDMLVTDLFMPMEIFPNFCSTKQDIEKRSEILGNIPMGLFIKMKAQQHGIEKIAIVSRLETHGVVRGKNTQLEAYVGELIARTGFGVRANLEECAIFPGYVISGYKEWIDEDYIQFGGYAHCTRQLLLGSSNWARDGIYLEN